MEKALEQTTLLDSEALVRQNRNITYLMKLDVANLLFPFYWEAGLTGSINCRMPNLHGGWDAQNSHIRGTFTGHYLSAVAHLSNQKQAKELKVRAEYIVEELGRCQSENGGQWIFPIPMSYVEGVKEGRNFWAPIYVCHKVLMGLLDMYLYAGNEQALDLIKNAAKWFVDFLERTSRAELTAMMDVQEAGGIMEFWADLYAVTKDEKHLHLMKGFERVALFEPLLEGKDVLTNMHANTTIPEVHGAARAYEVTGDIRYLQIAQNYWELAVTQRGMFATGGQTSGEVWTPMNHLSTRLGETNQEHCVVYNMIRLSDYLYRATKEKKYLDYIERNIINGIYAQGHGNPQVVETMGDQQKEESRIVAYYLPMKAGSKKNWGSETDHFWCCHCTLVQVHSRLREYIYYQEEKAITVAQFIPSEFTKTIEGCKITLRLTQTDLGGSCNKINETALNGIEKPECEAYTLQINCEHQQEFILKVRIPWWLTKQMECRINGQIVAYKEEGGMAVFHRSWKKEELEFIFPKTIQCISLPDEPDTVAFLDGPVVLAGLTGEERTLYGDVSNPKSFIKPSNERMWSNWGSEYKTVKQPEKNVFFKPLNQIVDEVYTLYFPVRGETLRKN